MRTSAWWRALAQTAACTDAAGGAPAGGQDVPRLEAAAATSGAAPSTTAASGPQGGTQTGWRADIA
eukprot:4202111-Pleurochrysis_carterae.AAC.1